MGALTVARDLLTSLDGDADAEGSRSDPRHAFTAAARPGPLKGPGASLFGAASERERGAENVDVRASVVRRDDA